jgi:uncharacterized protein (TIGR02391 family)
MPRKGNVRKESVSPTMSPQQAIPLIRRQIERLDEIFSLNFRDPRIEAWQSTTINILNAVYGLPNGAMHPNTAAVHRNGPSTFFSIGDPDADQPVFQEKLRASKDLLQAYIEQLEILAPPAAQTAPDQYRFHAEIEKVSGQLYRDGHYKQAALEAYIRVIEEVKRKSGIDDDGDSLMNRAFGCDKQTPVIQFNSLQSDAERDEQKGFMFLFKGIVSLRNSKAHSNTLFNDPSRAHEYLALASLLMRVLEIATINRP